MILWSKYCLEFDPPKVAAWKPWHVVVAGYALVVSLRGQAQIIAWEQMR